MFFVSLKEYNCYKHSVLTVIQICKEKSEPRFQMVRKYLKNESYLSLWKSDSGVNGLVK